MDQPGPPSDAASPEKSRGQSRKIANSLVALSSAAVLTVYAAGYLRTRAAAARFAVVEAADGRTAAPIAAAPRETPTEGTPAEAPASIPTPSVPKDDVTVPPREVVPAEPSATLVADSTPSTSSPAPADESTVPSPPAAASDPAPSDANAATPEPPAAPAPAPARENKFKDGTYKGWGYSRHGDIEAAVVIQDGRVVSAEITQCLTRYSCSVIDTLPAQVLSRQNAFVDLISGATESANAYSNAIFRALVASQK